MMGWGLKIQVNENKYIYIMEVNFAKIQLNLVKLNEIVTILFMSELCQQGPFVDWYSYSKY